MMLVKVFQDNPPSPPATGWPSEPGNETIASNRPGADLAKLVLVPELAGCGHRGTDCCQT